MPDSATDLKTVSHFIEGEWVENEGDRWLPGFDPTTGEPWYRIAAGRPADVERAVSAARRAFSDRLWTDTSQTKRGSMLRRLGDLVAERVDDLARTETRDTGKLLRETRGQVSRVPEFFYYYGGLADKIEGAVIPATKSALLNYTRREPVGVVAAIVPWNSPLQLAAMKLAPALACGNAVVVKPSEHASAALAELMPLFEEAGFPPGLVNLVVGDGEPGAALVENAGVNKVAFTGGTDSGRKVAMSAASHFAATTLELGGKSAQLVFADADPQAASMGVLAGVFAAGGQTCVAGSRAFVHASLYDQVCEIVAERARRIKVGDPLADETEIGPLAVEAQLQRVEGFVASGVQEGASLRAGGSRPDGSSAGWFYSPTVFSDISNEMRIAREEIFGPVLAIGKFESDDEAVALANGTRFGLAAGVWTNDLRRAHTVAERLEAGTVWINTYRSLSPVSPFGGVKESGLGRENGIEAVLAYTHTKSIWVNLAEESIADPFVGR